MPGILYEEISEPRPEPTPEPIPAIDQLRMERDNGNLTNVTWPNL